MAFRKMAVIPFPGNEGPNVMDPLRTILNRWEPLQQ